jgi:hypothetical protein
MIRWTLHIASMGQRIQAIFNRTIWRKETMAYMVLMFQWILWK